MSTSNASLSTYNSVNATSAVSANSSSSNQQAQTVAGLTMNVIDLAIEFAGKDLGLSRSEIDLAQAAAHAACGDETGVIKNLNQATDAYMKELNPIDRGYIDRTVNSQASDLSNIVQNNLRQANDTQQSADESTGAKGEAKNFFQAIAKILGKILGDKASEMVGSLKDLEKAGGKIDETGKSEDQIKLLMQDQAQKFGIAQSKFSADSQEYSMMSNLVNTVIKGIGEAMSTLARKS